MRRLLGVAALVLSLALLMPGNVRGDDIDESYYPLKESMRWDYSITSDKGATKKLVITNLPPREVNEKKVTPRKWEVDGATFYELMYKDETGIYRFAEQKAEKEAPNILTPKELHLKFPVAKGSGWNMTTRLGNSRLSLSLTVESVSDDITVPAGAFKDCVKIKQEGGNDDVSVTGYEWYAPKVGVVRSMVAIKQKSPGGAGAAENRTYQLQVFKP